MNSDIVSPMQGTVLFIDVEIGDDVALGQRVALIESMKMEHEILTTSSGTVQKIHIEVGETVSEEQNLISLMLKEVSKDTESSVNEIDLDFIRDDLEAVNERHALGLDHRRRKAVERRRASQQRTARENLDDLVDGNLYIEYGPLAIAPQRKRRTLEDLIENTPADGMIGGIAEVNGHLFPDENSQCVIMSYDYTVLAGTQGGQNHRKKDRLFEIAKRLELPVIFFTEGGGGRPGDTDGLQVAGLDCLAFGLWAELSALVPLVGINSGYCFAGNAAILGCCDVVIATENSNIGMGGPAMIEGGGLGTYDP